MASPRCLFGLSPAGLRGLPGHQALAVELYPQAWLQGPVRPGRPYQEHIAPDDLALKIPRPHKPFRHDKAPIQEG
ncbi:hypothetical protein SRHO_G00118540 [Serrasalmus rhombeus]